MSTISIIGHTISCVGSQKSYIVLCTFYPLPKPQCCVLGVLVSDFLQSGCEQSPLDYCQSVLTQAELYS